MALARANGRRLLSRHIVSLCDRSVATSNFTRRCVIQRFSTEAANNQSSLPWYMRQEVSGNESKSNATDKVLADLKELLPPQPPTSLFPLLSQIRTDLGCQNVDVIDLRNIDPPSTFGKDAILVVASGVSVKHLQRIANLLGPWIKQQYNVVPKVEGVRTANQIRTAHRRLQKKPMREASALSNTDSWVAIDVNIDNIYLHIFTEEKRQEVNLESLWKPREAARNRFTKRFENEYVVPNKSVSATRSFHTSARTNVEVHSTIGSNHRIGPAPFEPYLQEAHNLLSEKSADDLLVNFSNSFPVFPSSEESLSKLRLLKELHLKYPHKFTLDAISNHLVLQQASGSCVSLEEFAVFLETICQSKEYGDSPQSITEWRAICKKKFACALNTISCTLRPSGVSIMQPEILENLFKMTWSSSCTATDKFLSERAFRILELFGYDNGQIPFNREFLALVFSTLASQNDSRYILLLINRIRLSGVQLDEDLLSSLLNALMEYHMEDFICYLLNSDIADEILQLTTSPKLKAVLDKCLFMVDKQEQSFKELRKFIRTGDTEESQNNYMQV